jgi:hypothetical protein
MGTRSTIALEFADGSVGQVYCHWDGYLSNNGKILLQHYMDPFKLQKLIDLGDLSSLGSEVEPEPYRFHTFDRPQEDVCVFYGRDRGELGVNVRYFKDFADYAKNHQYEEFEYILRTDGNWYVSQGEKYESLIETYVEYLRQQDEQEETV